MKVSMEEEEANMEGGNMMHEEDPFESIRISTSQQELLNTVPFVGDTLTSPCNCNHVDSTTTAEIIPPDTHHVYDPPLPSSFIQCEFNQAIIDVDDVSQIFVHFPGFQKDSEFLQQDRLSDFSDIHPHQFSILDRAISDFYKAPVKKFKLGLDPLNVEQDSDEFRNFENEISSFCEENDADDDVNMVDFEGNKSILEEEIMEISKMRKGPVLDLMPDSIRSSFEKATANERGSGEDKEKEKEKEKETVTVFDVLKFLAETAVKEDDGLTLLETIKRAGVIFPRPSWWPDDMKSELFNLR